MEAKILKYLETEFEKGLFLASINYLKNHNDPLRFNSFSYSLRELVRNIFAARAPDELLKCCSWFKIETDNGMPTRQQRYIYCIQGGLSHSFVRSELDMEILSFWKDIKDSIDTLSKYTHVTEGTFGIPQEQCDKLSAEALSSLLDIFDLMSDAKTELIFKLEKRINQELMSTFVSNAMSDIDILSHSSYVEHAEVTESEIVYIDNAHIKFQGEGTAYVSLNYGKGDDACELNDEYPFTFSGASLVNSPYQLTISPDDISIDVSSWFGEDESE